MERLERDIAMESGVVGAIDRAHSALAERSEDFKCAESAYQAQTAWARTAQPGTRKANCEELLQGPPDNCSQAETCAEITRDGARAISAPGAQEPSRSASTAICGFSL